MEVPDIVNWLKGNELLLTSLYPIKDDEEAQKNLIRELHTNGKRVPWQLNQTDSWNIFLTVFWKQQKNTVFL
ncbi:PucR family transcriptional regulator ligand-binding domain-containing protein [Sinobaca sp. H24]|uniref:PucR family transcriptional regulator ligand-binding domain-containing protein n=1 Tax=Sinobaca sp. H24 TaxID=2923376 RepID=UPI0035B04DD3